jgi:hypothetical protein
MLFAFLCGHVAPLAVAAALGGAVLNRVTAAGAFDAVSTISAGCTISLGLYYACAA